MKNYAIKWKADNGRSGQGSFLFEQSEAEEIARNLNCDYPTIVHEAVKVPTDSVGNGAVENAQPKNHEQDQEHNKPTAVDVRKRTVRDKHPYGA
jgi:hypothetical protein